jgi:beta-phosphoglucomutase-like phosphatase (HAD superfamily)
MAGVAAGCTVFGYAPAHLQTTERAALLAAGASHTFADMLDLPSLLNKSY